MDSLVLQAWGDESFRTAGVERPSYLLGAAVADVSHCEDMRAELQRLPRRGPKLHWRDQDRRARDASIAAISGFDAYHVIVIAAPVDPRRQERARALCLERLAWQLDAQGVRLLTLEARPPQLMRRDLRTVDALRGKLALPEGLRIDHAQPSEEPMVWIADQVLGALGEKLAGGRSEWFDAVSPVTTIQQIPL
ncbi:MULTISPECIES: hypothetical protein [unclassified Microbacterium]|uniref:hypothetical protein n=1 Tax=unclassified Microbacterium TaxID=2609290 RepID=UPI0016053556|nr:MULTISPECIES: hypothetical protein [unclassified Microbacterium]QNA91569.1 hypothetical protein G4G29_02325 [Microbacterium sp. Se63.02b]QYM64744.1 hypothetical protein K1X59_02330 [Microbacterium sp. Se5.02b]